MKMQNENSKWRWSYMWKWWMWWNVVNEMYRFYLWKWRLRFADRTRKNRNQPLLINIKSIVSNINLFAKTLTSPLPLVNAKCYAKKSDEYEDENKLIN